MTCCSLRHVLTVPEAARRTGKNPETIRRWIRAGRLEARKVGTQHVIEERDLLAAATDPDAPAIPALLQRFESGRPQPDWTDLLQRQRGEH